MLHVACLAFGRALEGGLLQKAGSGPQVHVTPPQPPVGSPAFISTAALQQSGGGELGEQGNV